VQSRPGALKESLSVSNKNQMDKTMYYIKMYNYFQHKAEINE